MYGFKHSFSENECKYYAEHYTYEGSKIFRYVLGKLRNINKRRYSYKVKEKHNGGTAKVDKQKNSNGKCKKEAKPANRNFIMTFNRRSPPCSQHL